MGDLLTGEFDILSVIGLAAALFLGMLAMSELGRRLAKRRFAAEPDAMEGRSGVIDGAVFGLLGLLIAFTFSGAAARFDVRRQLVIQEANDVGTAWLRLDLLPANEQPPLRDLFRRYLDIRIEIYRAIPDMDAVEAGLARAAELQADIWTRAVAACQSPVGQRAIVVLLPALNEMFDTATTRTMTARMHQPRIIFQLLVTLGLICAMFAGYSMATTSHRNWTHAIGFAAVFALTFYVILDLEYPRRGLIRVDKMDQALLDLRASMD